MKKVLQKRAKSSPSLTHTRRMERAIDLDTRAEFAQAHLERLQDMFKALLADENFLTLLRAESIKTVPNHMKITMKGAGKEIPKPKASLSRRPSGPPKTLALDQLTLTICCRYATSLLANARIK